MKKVTKEVMKAVDDILNELDSRKGFEIHDIDEDVLGEIKECLAAIIMPLTN